MRVPAKPCDSQYHGVTSFESAVVMISRQPAITRGPTTSPSWIACHSDGSMSHASFAPTTEV